MDCRYGLKRESAFKDGQGVETGLRLDFGGEGSAGVEEGDGAVAVQTHSKCDVDTGTFSGTALVDAH